MNLLGDERLPSGLPELARQPSGLYAADESVWTPGVAVWTPGSTTFEDARYGLAADFMDYAEFEALCGGNVALLDAYQYAHGPVYRVETDWEGGDLGASIKKKIRAGLRKVGAAFRQAFKAIGRWLKKNWKFLVRWVCKFVGNIIKCIPVIGKLIGSAIIAAGEIIVGLVEGILAAVKKGKKGGFWAFCKGFAKGVVKGVVSFCAQFVGKYTSDKSSLGKTAAAALQKVKDSPIGKEAQKIADAMEKVKRGSKEYKKLAKEFAAAGRQMDAPLVEADREVGKSYFQGPTTPDGVKVVREWKEEGRPEVIWRLDEQDQVWFMWDGGVPPAGIYQGVWNRASGSMVGPLSTKAAGKNAARVRDLAASIKANLPPDCIGITQKVASLSAVEAPVLTGTPGVAVGLGQTRTLTREEVLRLEAKSDPAKAAKIEQAVAGGEKIYTKGTTMAAGHTVAEARAKVQKALAGVPTWAWGVGGGVLAVGVLGAVLASRRPSTIVVRS